MNTTPKRAPSKVYLAGSRHDRLAINEIAQSVNAVSNWHQFPYGRDCWEEKAHFNFERLASANLFVAIVSPEHTSHGLMFELGAAKAIALSSARRLLIHVVVAGNVEQLHRNEWFFLHDTFFPKTYCQPSEVGQTVAEVLMMLDDVREMLS